jgi:hypothetical protein
MTNTHQPDYSADLRPEVSKDFQDIKTNDKPDEDFRIYSEETSEPRVVEHYRDMRRFQTIGFYRKMEDKYSFQAGKYRMLMTIEEAFAELEHYVVGNRFGVLDSSAS